MLIHIPFTADDLVVLVELEIIDVRHLGELVFGRIISVQVRLAPRSQHTRRYAQSETLSIGARMNGLESSRLPTFNC